MDDHELQELQDPESWDDRYDQILPPAESPHAVVAVAFPREDFARVAECARRHGMKTSEFIRQAALDHVARPQGAPSARAS